ncbi:MAG TPA: cytochrome c oxidase assembly protein [Rhodanobacteraceae bacterium]|nr:cytochrome c oxidase assembly protein [Rhodanobacteraceae bacterium]
MRRLSAPLQPRRLALLLAGLGASATAAAHGSEGGGLHWVWDPWLLVCMAIAIVPYALGMARMARTQRRTVLGGWRAASFFAGMTLLLLALESPLDVLADVLFSAHMTQHMLLLLVIPPLLVAGRPVITWLWAFDVQARQGVVRGWSRSGLDAIFRWLMRPLVVWLLLTAALCVWHLPGPYDAAVRTEWLHDLEHLSFLAFSLAFWTIVIEPYGKRRALSHGATIVFIVAAGFVMGMIGAILVFAPQPLYAVHVHDAARYGLTALADQQLAGVIMWIPSNLIHVAALCVVFFAWLRADEQRAPRLRSLSRGASFGLVLVSLAALVLVGCAGGGNEDNGQLADSGADPQRGAALINRYGCGGCHTIPGISGADGLVGPPLTHWSQRSYIAGLLANNPDNLSLWISHPQKVLPGVDMPDMGVSTADAEDIAAYLETIR